MTPNTGPRRPRCHADLAGGGARHDLRHGEDAGAVLALRAGSRDSSPRSSRSRRRRRRRRRPSDRCCRHRAASPDCCMASRAAITASRLKRSIDTSLLAVDAVVGQRLDLAADLDLQVVQRRIGDRADGGAAGAHRVPDCGRIGAEPANPADAGDDDALLHSVRLFSRSVREPPRPCRRHSSGCSRRRPCSSRSRCHTASSRSKMISVSSSEWMPSAVSSVLVVISSPPGSACALIFSMISVASWSAIRFLPHCCRTMVRQCLFPRSSRRPRLESPPGTRRRRARCLLYRNGNASRQQAIYRQSRGPRRYPVDGIRPTCGAAAAAKAPRRAREAAPYVYRCRPRI